MRLCQELVKQDMWTGLLPRTGAGKPPWEQIVIGEELGCGEPRGPQYMNTTGSRGHHHGHTVSRRNSSSRRSWRARSCGARGFRARRRTDSASMRTTAVRDGDYYVVNGQKIWTSYAQCRPVLLPARPHQHRGSQAARHLSPAVADGPARRRGARDPQRAGPHAIHELHFDDVHVPVSCRLGGENEGWPLIRTVLADERIGAARFERASRVLASGMAGTPAGVPPIRSPRPGLATSQAARMLAYAAVQDRIDGRDVAPAAPSTSRVASIAAERAATQVLVSERGQESEAIGNPADEPSHGVHAG